MEVLRTIFPAFEWLSGYERDDLEGDLAAGATVGVMLIPQSMAYALLAGVPPIYGLYAGLVPLFIYTLLGTARHLAIGPVTVDMLIVGTGVGAAAGAVEGPDLEQKIAFAILVAAMTGVIEILMGLFRFGFMVNFLSRPVIAGFMTAAPLIIAANQIGSLLGIEMEGSQSVFQQIAMAVQRFGDVNGPAVAIGALGIVLLVSIQYFKPRWPGALIWVLVAGGLVWGFGLADGTVRTVGNSYDIPVGLPPLMPPFDTEYFTLDTLYRLAPTALTLALVQFMYVMSLGEAFASDHDYSVDANRELFAIGTSNVIGSFFRSIPVSGSFSRSAVNNRSGASSPLANVVAASLVGLTLLFLTGLFWYLPISALAAIIMVACLGMIDIPELKHLLETRWVDGAVALATFAATLYLGIQEGILIGVGISIVIVLYDLSQPHIVELGHVPGTREFRDLDRHPEAERISNVYLLRVDSRFAFANAKVLKEKLTEKAEDEGIEALVIDTTGVNDLDTTATQALREVVEELADRNVEFYVAGAKGPVRDVMDSAGLRELIGDGHFFLNAHQAVTHIVEEREQEDEYEPSRQDDRREQIEEAREKLEEERERLEDERRSIDREKRRLQEEITRHESERDQIDTRRDQLRRELREAQKRREKLRSARRTIEQTREELEEQREELEEREEALDQRQESLDDRAERIDERRDRIGDVAEVPDAETEEIREHLRDIVEERRQLEDELQAHESERDDLDDTRKDLEATLEEAKRRRDQLREERERMERQEERMKEERREWQDERKRLEAERRKSGEAETAGDESKADASDAASGNEGESGDPNDTPSDSTD